MAIRKSAGAGYPGTKHGPYYKGAIGLELMTSIRNFRIPKSYTPPLLITGILFAAHISFGILDSYYNLITAVVSAYVVELILHRLVMGKWRNMSSAYISGISVGILIRSTLLWPYALCAMISVASKYVLRYKDRHIWNPSNFGIVVMIVLASDYMAILSIQWGNNMWAMLLIWIIGSISIAKIKRFHICATYVVSFLALAVVRSWFTGDPYFAEIAPLTGPMYQLFVFFMITDPKTTVDNRKGQYLVAFSIAFVEMFFRLNEAVYAPFYALFLVGPIAMVVDLWLKDTKQQENKVLARE
ncbi:MAG: RnfABCDGE type electron transport complex subunit D [Balneolales bacterium]